MTPLSSPSLTRRRFLKDSAQALGAGLASSSLGASASMPPYERTLRDRLWMWGHDKGSLLPGYGIGGQDTDIEPAAALEHMGIPNCCMVRFTGTPLPPFDEYVKQFAKTKRLTWSIVDGARNFTHEEKRRQGLDLASRTPNLMGLDLDDFFLGDAAPKNGSSEASANLTVSQLAQAREEIRMADPRLQLSMVIYSNQVRPEISAHVDLVDTVYFWTWKALDLVNLESNFAAYRKVAPTMPTLLGIYMWDFGEKKTIPVELMKHQCRLGLEWLKKGEIEGLIFHCTPLCGMKLEAVEWSKDWISRHADDVVRA